MGGATPKLMLPLAGRPIITRTIDSLAESGVIERIVLMVPAEREGDFRKFEFDAPIPVDVAIGGATRRESVLKGLERIAASGRDLDEALVLVHDGARCFVDVGLIRRTVEAAEQYGAATAAIPAVDSIKRVGSDGLVLGSLDRSTLWNVQTPQVFRFRLLERAHKEARCEATDDASLVEPLHPVKVVLGTSLNFKVTTPENYRLAQAVCAMEQPVTPAPRSKFSCRHMRAAREEAGRR